MALDFIELCFQTRWQCGGNKSVDAVNAIFQEEGIGYELTPLVEIEIEESSIFGRKLVGKAYRYDYPKIIPKDNELLHAEIAKPALHLLGDPKYKTANDEFLEAFEDLKKRDFDDCLTKCCSALESVMKIICNEKGWPYNQHDTASPLIKTMIDKADLPSFFEQPLMIIATLRNRLSRSHGAGTEAKDVPEHLAQYSVHATAAAIILVTQAAHTTK